jgi:hypothetical protein
MAIRRADIQWDQVAPMLVIKARYMLSPQEPPPFQWGIIIGLGCFVAALLTIAVAWGWL